jgi:hypothetical protein
MRPELGELTLWGALLLPAMYIVNHGVRRANRWSGGRPPRRENVGALLMFYSVIGALAGSFCQPVWTRSAACTHDRRGAVGCFFDDVAEPAIERAREAAPAIERAGRKLRAGESELERRLDPEGRLDPIRRLDPDARPEVERRPEPERLEPERRPEVDRRSVTAPERPMTSERRPPSGNP